MTKTRRATVATLAALALSTPVLTACNLTSPSTCDALSLSATAGGKGGGGKSSGKSSTTKTKQKPPVVVHHDSDDDCDDD